MYDLIYFFQVGNRERRLGAGGSSGGVGVGGGAPDSSLPPNVVTTGTPKVITLTR